jgi:hypothetical protein
MDFLYRVFGPPHELLHVLALLLIGRRPLQMSWRHVDIPDDLSISQYVFVAGLPAAVFWGVALSGLVLLAQSLSVDGVMLGMFLMLVGGLAGLGTLGDLQLIIARLQEGEPPAD